MRDMLDFGGPPGLLNARNLIAGALAVVFVLGGWFGLRSLLAEDAEPPPPPPPAAEPEPVAEAPPPEEPEEEEEDDAAYPTVLVAKQRIAAGELLAQNLMDWRQWRQPIEAQSAFVKNDGFFFRDDEEFSVERLFGAVARSPIEAGTPIYRDAIIAPGFPGFITAVLAPGHRAITINVSGTATRSEIIHPGDRVDVILFYPSGADRPDLGPVAQAIVSDVRVLVIGSRGLRARQQDQFGDAGGGAPAAAGEPFTLEVPSADVERIVLAASTGQLDLALRSTLPSPEGEYQDVPSGLVGLDDLVPLPPLPPPPPEEAAALVRIIRGDSGASEEAGLLSEVRLLPEALAEQGAGS